MKKLICLLTSLCLMLTVFAACSGGFTGVKDYEGEVSSNGGFAVVKGDYVYFINGSADNTVDNTFGAVVKGSLVRAKLADVNDYGKPTECEIVVPKLFYTDYDDPMSGFYIFGDYVYYPTTSTGKDNTGAIKNTVVEFTKTKLDGTGTSVIASADSLSTPYRFNEKDGKVYLTVYTSVKDGDDTVNKLVTYSEDGKKATESQAVSTYVFPTDGSGYAYYEKKAHNADLDEDEDFNEVYRYSLTGDGETKVLSGAGMYTDAENGIGTQGVNYTFVKLTGDALFLSVKYVDTSVTTITRYYGIALTDLTENTPFTALTLLNRGTSEASSIFSSSSVYYALDKIFYNDSTYGLVMYDYHNEADLKTFGIEQLVYNSDLMSYTYCFDDGEYMYYTADNYYYRIKIADALTGNDDIAIQQMTYTATSGTDEFYRFELIGNTILTLNTHDPFYDYVCAYDITTLDNLTVKDGQTKEEAVKEFIEEFATADREHVLSRLNYRVAKLSEEDQTALDEYLESNYPEDSASE